MTRRRRWAWVATAGLAAASAVVIALVVRDSDPTGPVRTGQSLSNVEEVACAVWILEGELTDVVKTRDRDLLLLTVQVTEWVKPQRRPDVEVQVQAASPAFTGEPAFRRGEPVLAMVLDGPDDRAEVFRDDNPRGESTDVVRARIDKNLPASKDVTCPDFWRDRESNPQEVRGDS